MASPQGFEPRTHGLEGRYSIHHVNRGGGNECMKGKIKRGKAILFLCSCSFCALLRPLDVAVGRLDELEEDVLHVLVHVAGLGQGGGVDDGEGHVEQVSSNFLCSL